MISENTADNPYYYQYAKGIKTGSHDQAGYCLVSSAIYDGYTYICVALGAPSVDANGKEIEERGEMIDSKNLYRWAFTTLEQKGHSEKYRYGCGSENRLCLESRQIVAVARKRFLHHFTVRC